MEILKHRLKDTHKGDYGHLFILGGSCGLTGAVCLAAVAAIRSGCGLVTAGIPASLNDIMEIKLTEVMSLPLPETSERTFSLKALKSAVTFAQKNADAVLIGPGISTNTETCQFIKDFILQSDKPIIADADALRATGSCPEILKSKKHKTVLTPHPGEMSCLAGHPVAGIQENREKTAVAFAKKFNAVVVLKGHRTVITDGNKISVNLTGNPGMATAGCGDILAGIIGSLVAQGMDSFHAAETGAYVHGLAGNFAAKDFGQISMIASDIITMLPEAFKYSRRL